MIPSISYHTRKEDKNEEERLRFVVHLLTTTSVDEDVVAPAQIQIYDGQLIMMNLANSGWS